MTLDEFKETLVEGWEIDFTIGELNFHYQRFGQDGKFQLCLTTASETLYEEVVDDMNGVIDDLMALPIYDGKTIGQLEAKITVVSSS